MSYAESSPTVLWVVNVVAGFISVRTAEWRYLHEMFCSEA